MVSANGLGALRVGAVYAEESWGQTCQWERWEQG